MDDEHGVYRQQLLGEQNRRPHTHHTRHIDRRSRHCYTTTPPTQGGSSNSWQYRAAAAPLASIGAARTTPIEGPKLSSTCLTQSYFRPSSRRSHRNETISNMNIRGHYVHSNTGRIDQHVISGKVGKKQCCYTAAYFTKGIDREKTTRSVMALLQLTLPQDVVYRLTITHTDIQMLRFITLHSRS